MQGTGERSRSSGRRGPGAFWLFVVNLLLFNALLAVLVWSLGRHAVEVFGLGPNYEPPAPVAAPAAPAVIRGHVTSRIAKGVGSHFSAPVESLEVRKGQRVTRGQLLFRMDVGQIDRGIAEMQRQKRAAAAKVAGARRERDQELKWIRRRIATLERELERARRDLRRTRRAHQGSHALPGPPYGSAAYTDWASSLYRDVSSRSARVEALAQRVRAARAWYKARERAGHQTVVAALEEQRRASRALDEYHQRRKHAKRYSPIDGVVTSIRAGEGDWVAARRPIVRVDDPSGYRVVCLIQDDEALRVEPGEPVTVRLNERELAAELQKVQAGWGRELFRRWLWLKPAETTGLSPGQEVQVVLPGEARSGDRTFARR